VSPDLGAAAIAADVISIEKVTSIDSFFTLSSLDKKLPSSVFPTTSRAIMLARGLFY
jgi:hypothetical protein